MLITNQQELEIAKEYIRIYAGEPVEIELDWGPAFKVCGSEIACLRLYRVFARHHMPQYYSQIRYIYEQDVFCIDIYLPLMFTLSEFFGLKDMPLLRTEIDAINKRAASLCCRKCRCFEPSMIATTRGLTCYQCGTEYVRRPEFLEPQL